MQLVRKPFGLSLFNRELGNFFDDFLASGSSVEKTSNWQPAVDISEDKDHYFLHLDVPGIAKDDIKVNVKERTLTISGEKKAEKKDEGRTWFQVERTHGSFCRSFALPETADIEKIKADYRNGTLELSIAKKEEAKPKQIEVHVS